MCPFDINDSRGILIGTKANGFLVFNGHVFIPFISEVDDYLKKNIIYQGIRLSTGDYAAVTLKGGLVIFDNKGHLKYIFNKGDGLQDNTINCIFEDDGGNLWLALSNGISRLEYGSPFYHSDGRNGLEGMVLTVIQHKDNLYAGTMQGIYRLHPGSEKFMPINDIGTCWDLLSTEQALLAATDNGVYRIDIVNDKPPKVLESQTFKLVASRLFSNHTWCATNNGLVSLVWNNNSWKIESRFSEINGSIINALEDPNGHLWLITSEGDILKVNFPGDISKPSIKRFKREGKLHEEEISMALVEGKVVLASRKGLLFYDEKSDDFIPDMVLGKEFAYGPGARPVFRIIQGNDRNIWFHSESRNYRAIPNPGKTFLIEAGPFPRIPLGQVNAIYPGNNEKNTWFAGVAGLIQYDRTVLVRWNREFPVLIRGMFSDETIPIYGGYANDREEQSPLIIPYKNRNVIFNCAAPFFEREAETSFSYKLVGFGDNWSEWTTESRKHFTNLDAGSYTFRVRAKNIYGVIGKEDSLSFKVLPPWYRTWWAFLLFAIGFSAGFFLLLNAAVKRRSIKLLHEKKRLEQVVADRTREIQIKNERLQEQSEKLKEMDEVKSRFFANISHEFRTPLTLIMSPLEQLLSRTSDEGFKKSYRLMLRNSQQLLTLINRLLDLARFDSGKMKLQASYRDIVPFLQKVIASFRGLAEQKQLIIKSFDQTFSKGGWQPQPIEDMPPEAGVFLYFDAAKMEEVVSNLLSNAIKFTLPGGEIRVSIDTEAEKFARISVKDTGIGIPAGQLNNIFDRFFQAGKAKDRVGQGTGIGLSLVKEIILLHHGTIDVHSIEGKGTEFIIRLPMGKDHLGPDEIVIEQINPSERGQGEEVADMYLEPVGDINQSPEENEKVDSQEKTVILVVEDHDDMRHHIRGILEPGYGVIEAVNGKEGIALAKDVIPDLIISDIMMPEVDGYELCRVLKKDIKTSHIPVILLTAKASDKSVIQGLEKGADDYVTKPFNAEMLLARINNLIELRRQLQLKIQREKMLLPSEVVVSNQDDLFLKEFRAAIEKNLTDEDFNVDELCKKLLIGRSTLFRKIQALTGETPNDFIQGYRLERGAQLLRENYGNVTEVAMAVGFGSAQYFAKCFKDKFHRSPKEYQAAEGK
jgi:signal transduction histidine kinase/DNA-binding response OmpR family regulator